MLNTVWLLCRETQSMMNTWLRSINEISRAFLHVMQFAQLQTFGVGPVESVVRFWLESSVAYSGQVPGVWQRHAGRLYLNSPLPICSAQYQGMFNLPGTVAAQNGSSL